MILLVQSARRLQYFILGAAIGLLLLFSTSSLHAQSGPSIAQGFKTNDADIVSAALVSIKQNSTDSIELGSADDADNLVGVVSKEPLIELSQSDAEVEVVTSGPTLALVSDLNGDVKTGDKITASPIEGVGMKVTESTTVVGTAQADLKSVELEERKVTDRKGKSRTVKIGLLPVHVGVAYYSVGANESSFVPPFLQGLANSVAGRNVSLVRLMIALLILLLLLVSVTVLLYSAVKSSIISIGRNPLSASAVRKSLLEVGLTVLVVLVFSTSAIYLVLAV